MPCKIGGGNRPQSYDPSNGKYGYPLENKDNGTMQYQGHNTLTISQKNAIKKARNQIYDHLRCSEYEAIIIEKNGGHILKESGEPYDHIQEVVNALKGLKQQCESIERSLHNPFLSTRISKYLSQNLKHFKKTYNKFIDILGGEHI
ncbi:MAG: polymorphic toxin type 28 domain-containing protein [Bacilli bacterium]|nr:polymorphic toxin type 28 domain-containing protein [Bacilli bacterium]